MRSREALQLPAFRTFLAVSIVTMLLAGPLAVSAPSAPDVVASTLGLAATARGGPGTTFAPSHVFAGEADALAQGDADGDGLADVLLVTAEHSRAGAVIVIRVVTAAGEAWRFGAAASSYEVTPAVDLNGDGATDVLIRFVDAAGWSMFALRGFDGVPLWSQQGTAASQGVDVKIAYAGVSDGAPLVVFVGGDADGDGGSDLWITRVDRDARAGAFVTDTHASAGAVTAVRGDVLSGATGQLISTISAPVGPLGGGIVLPAADLDGDGLADTVATFQPLGPGASFVLAIDASGAPLWSREYAGANAFGSPIADATGDGTPDVIVTMGGPVEALEMLSGADGAAAWRHAAPLFLVTVPGDVDGAGGADVLMLEGDAFGQGTHVHAVLIAGETGAVLYDERPYFLELPANGGTSIEYVLDAGDFDADGTLDTLLHVESSVGEEILVRETVALLAQGARVHWVVRGAPSRAVGDATGDGATDVASAVPSKGGLLVTLLDGTTGAALWSQSPGFFAGAALDEVGDLDGDGRADVLATLVAVDGGGKEKGGGATTHLMAWNAEGRLVWPSGGGR